MARQLLGLLQSLADEVVLASGLRAFSLRPDPDRLASLHTAATTEIDVLAARFPSRGEVPDIWVTYHPYYKAPDLIGPHLASRWRIPYVTIEASYAAKRDRGEWAAWQRPVGEALRQAAVNICFTERDAAGIRALEGRTGRIAMLAPFLTAAPPARPVQPRVAGTPARLVAVAMMRPGDKLASYRILATALARLEPGGWHLTVVGDGPARGEVETAFAPLARDRITWLGELPPAAVQDVLGASDILVWPGIGEAYGLAYLEAASYGLPAVALDVAGVPAVVADGVSGLLAPAHADPSAAFAAALQRLLDDPAIAARLGAGALSRVRSTHSAAAAAARLAEILATVTSARGKSR